jgi:hypothetical protein
MASIATISCLDFALNVARAPLTAGQRALVAVAVDGIAPAALEGDAGAVAREMFGGVDELPAEARSLVAIVAGAGGGKSYVAAISLVWSALTTPCAPRPGEQMVALICAPDMRLARVTLRYAIGVCESVPSIARRVVGKTSDSITLKRRDGVLVTIEALPAGRGGAPTRGRRYVRAILDEADFFRSEGDGRVNDVDVFNSIASRVVADGQLVVQSTPWVEGATLLHRLWSENWQAPRTAIAAWAKTTILRDDDDTRRMVERERARDEENYRREFLAEWLPAGSGAFFDPVAVDRCVQIGPAVPTGYAVAGADFAFASDHSGLVVAASAGDRVVVTHIAERRPQRGAPLVPSAVATEFAMAARAAGARLLTSDGHYALAVAEHVSRVGLQWSPASSTAEGKLKTHMRCRELIHGGRLVISSHLPLAARLAQQLKDITSKPLPGGMIQLSSPRSARGGHGDLASAAVLAIAMVASATTAATFAPGGWGVRSQW